MYKRNGALLTGTFWQYLGPSLLSTTSILLGSIVDGIIVGNLIGPDAMSAVNLTQPVVLVVQALFFLFGMGAATAISIARGQREEAQANALFTMGSLCLLAVSIAVAALGTVGIDGVVAVLCSNEALSGLVRSYASAIIVGAPFMLVVPGLVYVIRVDGMPRMSAAVLVVANVVNLVLDLVFIAVFDMGIAGAALATVVGYAAGGCIVLGYFMSKRRTLRFASLGEPRKLLAPIIDGGVAPALNTCLLFAKILLLNRIVLAVAGQGGMEIFAVCNYAISFVSIFVSGAAEAMVPLLGMLFGERDARGMHIVFRRALLFVLIACGVSIAAMELAPELILAAFSITDESRLAVGVVGLRVFGLSLFVMGANLILMYYLQTVRRKSIAVAITVLRGFALVVPAAWLLSTQFGIDGVWWAFVIAEAATLAVAVAACLIVARRSHGALEGVLLTEKPDGSVALFDGSLRATKTDAVGVSTEVIAFARANGLDDAMANTVGLMVEEAVVNIAETNAPCDRGRSASKAADPVGVDVLVRIDPDEIRIAVRDGGVALDALTAPRGSAEEFTGITVMRAMAERVEYARTLGLNDTLVLLSRDRKHAGCVS